MVEETEIWKQIKTRYSEIEVSNFGNVRGKRWNRHPFTNNDINEIFCYECPEGFIKGRIKRKKGTN